MIKLTTLCRNYLAAQFWLADSTQETTERAFRYLVGFVGDLCIDRLTFQHAERYRNWLLKSGRSKNTANIYLRSLKPVFGWAIRLKLLGENPVTVKSFKVTQKPIRVYEDWEIQRMLRYSPCSAWRLRLMLGRYCGLRRGEVLNLTLNNVRNGFVFVEPKRNTKTTWEWEPKDKEIRKIPLPDSLAAVMRSCTCLYPAIGARRYGTLLRLMDAGLLTGRRRRCPVENFRREFVRIQRRAFGRQIGTFHDLRRTYITEMASSLPEYFVCKLSGHSDTRTMVTYYTAIRESQYQDARRIAENATKNGMPVARSCERRQTARHPELGGTGFDPVTSCV